MLKRSTRIVLCLALIGTNVHVPPIAEASATLRSATQSILDQQALTPAALWQRSTYQVPVVKPVLRSAHTLLKIGSQKNFRSVFHSIQEGEIHAGPLRFSVTLGFNDHGVAEYLRIGTLEIVNEDYVRQQTPGATIHADVIRLHGPLTFAPYAAPLIADMIRHQNRFQDAVVEDIGTGHGLLAAVALRLGAKRVIGIDLDKDALARAKKDLGAAFWEQAMDAVE